MKLHSPVRIGGATIRNRLPPPVLEVRATAATCARYATHFVENARHGVGLIIQGSSCILPEGRVARHDLCRYGRR